MAIREVSKYNYEEICKELNIDYQDFLALIQNKGINSSINSEVVQQKAIFVIDQFIKNILEHEIRVKSINTIKYYLSFLTRFRKYIANKNENLHFSNLNEDILYKFLIEEFENRKKDKSQKEGFSQSSINTYIAIIKRLCTFANELDYIDKNIGYKFHKIKVHYLPRYFTKEHLQNFFEILDKRRCTLLWKTIFITLLGTGLRVDELSKLRLRDIDFENNLIYTLGKGKKERYIPLYPEVKQAIQYYLSATGVKNISEAKNGFVFSREEGNNRNRKVSARSIQYTVQKIRSELELDERFTVHSFRHTFAVNCLKSEMPLLYLSQILGHESPETTSIYTKLLPKDLSDEISNKFPFPLEGLVKEIIVGDDSNGSNDTGD